MDSLRENAPRAGESYIFAVEHWSVVAEGEVSNLSGSMGKESC